MVAGNTKDLELVFKNNESSGFDLELSLDLPLSDFILGGNTSFTLAPSASKTITVRYTPTQNTSTKTIEVSHNSTTRPNPAKVQLAGIKDISAAIISLNTEGWALFTSKDYGLSRKKFQDAIVASFASSIYDSLSDEATVGRGWATLFAQESNDFAQGAFNDFKNTYLNNLVSQNSQYNILAGMSISGVLMTTQSNDHYTDIVGAATRLLDSVSKYEFSYNTKIDYKDVRYALIQAYFNLSNYTSAADQLDILDPVNAPHSASPEDVLNAIQALAGQL